MLKAVFGILFYFVFNICMNKFNTTNDAKYLYKYRFVDIMLPIKRRIFVLHFKWGIFTFRWHRCVFDCKGKLTTATYSNEQTVPIIPNTIYMRSMGIRLIRTTWSTLDQ